MLLAQLQAFKAAINGDANTLADRTASNHGNIAAYYNGAGTGTIWRPNIQVSEVNTAIVGSEFVALTAIKQNLFVVLTNGGVVDATSANIRANFTAIFTSGTSLANLTAMAQRVPTRFEALFAVSQVVPVALFGYIVSASDIAAALGS